MLKVLKNGYFQFAFFTVFFVAWVIWIGHYWLLAVELIAADYFIFKIMPWHFIKKIKNKKIRGLFEWSIFIAKALFVVLFIRIFFFRSYYIPTSSMENTLFPGDYIFVNKIKYGPRMPMRPLSFPFVHNIIPFGDKRKSYSDKVQLPYQKLNGYGKIEREDLIVFNFPEGDTVIHPFNGQSYYSLTRKWGHKYVYDKYELRTHPIVKRENFIKRCIALPGDVIEIEKGKILVNNKEMPENENSKHKYYIKTNKKTIDELPLDSFQLLNYQIISNKDNILFEAPLCKQNAARLKEFPEIEGVMKHENTNYTLYKDKIFPHHKDFQWTEDFFGPVYVPQKGHIIRLTTKNLPLYQRIIHFYEDNKFLVQNDSIFINDSLAFDYTFKMNYYFVIGDNRHYSMDSRYWGFVPENHIEGKAEFIWFSVSKKNPEKKLKVRWKRVLKKLK